MSKPASTQNVQTETTGSAQILPDNNNDNLPTLMKVSVHDTKLTPLGGHFLFDASAAAEDSGPATSEPCLGSAIPNPDILAHPSTSESKISASTSPPASSTPRQNQQQSISSLVTSYMAELARIAKAKADQAEQLTQTGDDDRDSLNSGMFYLWPALFSPPSFSLN